MMHESEDASLKYAQLVDSATTEFRQETPSLSKAYNKRSKQERRLLNRFARLCWGACFVSFGVGTNAVLLCFQAP
jgi:hypothetical protein